MSPAISFADLLKGCLDLLQASRQIVQKSALSICKKSGIATLTVEMKHKKSLRVLLAADTDSHQDKKRHLRGQIKRDQFKASPIP